MTATVSFICQNQNFILKTALFDSICSLYKDGRNMEEKEGEFFKAELRFKRGKPGAQDAQIKEALPLGSVQMPTPHFHDPERERLFKLCAVDVSFALP